MIRTKLHHRLTSLSVALILALVARAESRSELWEVITIAGTGEKGYSPDGTQARAAKINNPYGVVAGADGAVYFCDMDNHVVRKIEKSGEIRTVAGTGRRGRSNDGLPATATDLNEPYEARFDRAGNLVFVEMKGAAVRLVEKSSGLIRTLAGDGIEGFAGDGGPATFARLRQPHSIQFDSKGNLYICDIGNNRVRKVGDTGIIQTIAGSDVRRLPDPNLLVDASPLHGPRAIDFDEQGNIWLALREGNAVYRSCGNTPKARWQLMAGNGEKGFTGNGGAATTARLSGPKGLSVANNGDAFLADTESHTIRVIRAKTGIIECVLGDGQRGNGEDGDPLKCRLARPHGVYATKSGDVLIGDSENHKIRLLRRKR